MKRKGDLDNYITATTGIPLYVVRQVTRTWVEAVQHGLAEAGSVLIEGFGTLTAEFRSPRKGVLVPKYDYKAKKATMVVMDVPEQLHVNFRKAKQLSLVVKAGKEAGHVSGRRNGQVRRRRKQ